MLTFQALAFCLTYRKIFAYGKIKSKRKSLVKGKKKKKCLKKKESAPFSQEKKKILAAMKSLSIQSLMISLTAAFSGLLALR